MYSCTCAAGRDGIWSSTKQKFLNVTAEVHDEFIGNGSVASTDPWFCHGAPLGPGCCSLASVLAPLNGSRLTGLRRAGYACPPFTTEWVNGTTSFEVRTYPKVSACLVLPGAEHEPCAG